MNAIHFTRGYALIATPGGVIETCLLAEGRYVRIDDMRYYPQLCAGASTRGNTLIYATDEQLARDCKARVYKTRLGFDAAVARIVEVFDLDDLT